MPTRRRSCCPGVAVAAIPGSVPLRVSSFTSDACLQSASFCPATDGLPGTAGPRPRLEVDSADS